MIGEGEKALRIVSVEEHIAFPELIALLPQAAMLTRGFLSRDQPFGAASQMDALYDSEDRLLKLDAAGVSVQVLSYPLPGAALLPPRKRISLV